MGDLATVELYLEAFYAVGQSYKLAFETAVLAVVFAAGLLSVRAVA